MCMIHWEEPVIMNLKKIRRLMNKFGLQCPIRKANPYRRMAKAIKTSNTADNLLKQQFTAHGPRKVLLTDITYIPYKVEGQAVLGRQHVSPTPWLTERHGYDPT